MYFTRQDRLRDGDLIAQVKWVLALTSECSSHSKQVLRTTLLSPEGMDTLDLGGGGEGRLMDALVQIKGRERELWRVGKSQPCLM